MDNKSKSGGVKVNKLWCFPSLPIDNGQLTMDNENKSGRVKVNKLWCFPSLSMVHYQLSIVWTARVAVVGWFVIALRDFARPARQSPRQPLWSLIVWNGACLTLILHVLLAFHFVHHWSHADAVRVTAERTAQTIGWAYGGGVYWNHAFLMIWSGDVVRRWHAWIVGQPRSRGWEWAIHGLCAFMIFNATVVFGPAWWRPAALVVVLPVAAVLFWRRGRTD